VCCVLPAATSATSTFCAGTIAFQNEGIQKHAPIGIYHEWAERLAEFLGEGIADGPNVFLVADKE